MRAARRILDGALEGTIVASFSKVGFDARQRLYEWSDDFSDLGGQVAVVTGGTSGIGKATAEALMDLGATVHITSRSQERADRVAAEMNLGGAEGRAVGHSLNTGDFASIDSFAGAMIAGDSSVDILVNNAGALTSEYRTDNRGRELTLSTHLIGPYRLTKALHPHLSEGARVIFMSSGGMYTQKLDVDNIEMSEEEYRGAIAYAKAKRGQVELVSYLGPVWAPQTLLHAVHPGWVDTAGVDAGLPGFGKLMGPILRTAEQGADTAIWLAANGANGAAAGQFWLDRRARRTVYLPGTGTTGAERKRLVEWLDEQIASESATE